MRMIKVTLCFALLAVFIAAAGGCRTTEGFGKDVEAGGRAIKNEAREHGN